MEGRKKLLGMENCLQQSSVFLLITTPRPPKGVIRPTVLQQLLMNTHKEALRKQASVF